MRMTKVYRRDHQKLDLFFVDPDYLHREGLASVCFQPEAGKKIMFALWDNYGKIFKRYPVQEVRIRRDGIEWQFDDPIGKFYASWDQVLVVEVEEYEETII